MGKNDLIAALQLCDAAEVCVLLAAGADPNIDDEGQSALGLAMENDDTFSAKLLIDAGADVKPDDLYEVLSPGMLRLLLAAGLKINSHNELGETPLYCNRGNEVLQSLLESGADPNIATDSHETPLSFHASWGNLHAAEVLLHAGADPNHYDPQVDCTVLFYAVQFGNRNIVEALVEAGADVNYCNKQGHSALSIALRSGDIALVELLMSHNAKLAPKCLEELDGLRRRIDELAKKA